MPLSKYSPRTLGIASAVITIAIWTGFIVVARFMALKSLLPLDIVFCRIAGASLVLLPWGYWLVRKQRSINPQAQSWLGISPLNFRTTALVGCFGGIGYSVLAYSGFVYAPAAHASVLMPGTLPLSTALLSVIFLGEKLTPQRMIGLAIILMGGLLVGGASIWNAIQQGGNVWRGDLLFFCSSSTWAIYAVLCRKNALSGVMATIAVMTFSALVYLPIYTLLVATDLLQSKLMSAPLWEIAFQAIWQGMGSVVISGITFTTMVKYFGPIRSTMMTAIVPGLSAMAAVLFLGEPLYWNLIAGLLMVTLGIIVGVLPRKAKATA
jgi:drug/metabolite transporter (DMT)-like permease